MGTDPFDMDARIREARARQETVGEPSPQPDQISDEEFMEKFRATTRKLVVLMDKAGNPGMTPFTAPAHGLHGKREDWGWAIGEFIYNEYTDGPGGPATDFLVLLPSGKVVDDDLREIKDPARIRRDYRPDMVADLVARYSLPW
jgi:hypothetical protein